LHPNRSSGGQGSGRNQLKILVVGHPEFLGHGAFRRSIKNQPTEIRTVKGETERDVVTELLKMGHDVSLLPITENFRSLERLLQTEPFELVFNLLEEVSSRPELEALLPYYLEERGVPYTGASGWSLMICRRKVAVQRVLRASGVRVPISMTASEYFRLDSRSGPSYKELLPVIVKLANEDASKMIRAQSVARTSKEVAEQVEWLQRASENPLTQDEILVEHFVPGRELHVTAFCDQTSLVLPYVETIFPKSFSGPTVLTEELKWKKKQYHRSGLKTVIRQQGSKDIERQIARASRVLSLSGVVRFDFRLDDDGLAYLIDVNPNPDLGRSQEVALSARAAHWPYKKLVSEVIRRALPPT
jgi:D-alanine-D-alanine ligase